MLGQAVARSPGGELRQLAVGDRIAEGELIITAQNGFVQLSDEAPVARPPAPDGPQPVVIESDGGSLQPALRVDGLSEAIATGTSLAAGPAAPGLFGGLRPQVDRLAPEATSQELTTLEDTGLLISLSGRDTDGALLRYLVVQVPTGGVMYRADGQPFGDGAELSLAEARELLFMPAPNFHGDPGPLLYRSVDSSGKASDLASIGIRVEAVNDAPRPGTLPIGPDDVAIADPSPQLLPGSGNYAYQTLADTPLSGRVNATDVDGDSLNFSAAAQPRHGQLAVDADGQFVYRPNPGFTGEDLFTLLIDDGQGGVATSTVFVEVAAQSPSATASSTAGAEGQHTALPLAWLPPGEDVFAWQLAEPPAAEALGLDIAHPGPLALAPMLDLRDLLQGFSEIPFEAYLAATTLSSPLEPSPPASALDLAVDWGLRSSGLDRLQPEAALPID
jgi:VCBS repeat-containing protein